MNFLKKIVNLPPPEALTSWNCLALADSVGYIALAWCITPQYGHIPKHFGEVSDRILPKEIS
jgi:hypothetical protein